jgi:hypothetical protein
VNGLAAWKTRVAPNQRGCSLIEFEERQAGPARPPVAHLATSQTGRPFECSLTTNPPSRRRRSKRVRGLPFQIVMQGRTKSNPMP